MNIFGREITGGSNQLTLVSCPGTISTELCTLMRVKGLTYIYTLPYLAQRLAASNVCHIFSKTETISIGKSWKLYTIYLVACIYTDY